MPTLVVEARPFKLVRYEADRELAARAAARLVAAGRVVQVVYEPEEGE